MLQYFCCNNTDYLLSVVCRHWLRKSRLVARYQIRMTHSILYHSKMDWMAFQIPTIFEGFCTLRQTALLLQRWLGDGCRACCQIGLSAKSNFEWPPFAILNHNSVKKKVFSHKCCINETETSSDKHRWPGPSAGMTWNHLGKTGGRERTLAVLTPATSYISYTSLTHWLSNRKKLLLIVVKSPYMCIYLETPGVSCLVLFEKDVFCLCCRKVLVLAAVFFRSCCIVVFSQRCPWIFVATGLR